MRPTAPDVLPPSVNIGKRLISDRLSSCPWSWKLGVTNSPNPVFELRKYILTRTRLRSVTLAITIYIYIYHVRPPPRAFLWTPHRTTLQT